MIEKKDLYRLSTLEEKIEELKDKLDERLEKMRKQLPPKRDEGEKTD